MELHFEPFELNPAMPREGEDAIRYLSRKYGAAPEQLARNRAALRERGAAVGFEFGERPLDMEHLRRASPAALGRARGPGPAAGPEACAAHRLPRPAENPGAREVLLRLAGEVGLDVERARAVLDSDEFAAEVRERERYWQELGIHSVPAVVIDGRHLISGGQPPEVFEQALRQIAAGA